MIGLDTNVLVRYLTGDDPKQSPQARRFVDEMLDEGEMLFVCHIVLCELVWVLSYAYDYSRDEIVSALQQLRRAAQLTVERPDEVRRALDAYAARKGDLADFLIAERSIASGCASIATFERDLQKDQRFRAPSKF
ncbi:MAG TPA: type II toxin-antitoxin system VapC family toxin [Thermoanaerobaculia bacterium]|nr:type II toxin-antitoxin system VapC family toxin [Thermoanaerobaculia bacterium]